MIIEYAHNPDICKNLNRKIKCKSFKNILKGSKGSNYTRWVFDLEREIYLVAKGMCQKIYERIDNIRYIFDLDLYIEKHPVFENDDEKNKYMTDMLEVIKNRYNNPYAIFGNEARYESSEYLKRLMEDYMSEDYADSLSTLYEMGTIDIIDIAKSLIVFGDFP